MVGWIIILKIYLLGRLDRRGTQLLYNKAVIIQVFLISNIQTHSSGNRIISAWYLMSLSMRPE